eukprot:m.22662 g.22662  ORF g.22662 m.22662 type:complete len:285 (+) comp8879_c0_seq1:75-929(+)
MDAGEREGLEWFLSRNYSDDDAIKLAKIVLKKTYVHGFEARQALAEEGGQVQNVLGRRMILKSHLESYTKAHNLKSPSSATKDQLITLIASHWSSKADVTDQKPSLSLTSTSHSNQQQMEHFDGHVGAKMEQYQQQQQEEEQEQYLAQEGSEEDAALELASGFCDVFFGSFNPLSFTNDLFFDDCTFTLIVNPGNNLETIQGGSRITSRFINMVQDDEIVLAPNQSSIRGMVEPHGCLGVMVHGTIHRPGSTAGLFQQKCILAQDPHLQNTWRVQSIDIECQMK